MSFVSLPSYQSCLSFACAIQIFWTYFPYQRLVRHLENFSSCNGCRGCTVNLYCLLQFLFFSFLKNSLESVVKFEKYHNWYQLKISESELPHSETKQRGIRQKCKQQGPGARSPLFTRQINQWSLLRKMIPIVLFDLTKLGVSYFVIHSKTLKLTQSTFWHFTIAFALQISGLL